MKEFRMFSEVVADHWSLKFEDSEQQAKKAKADVTYRKKAFPCIISINPDGVQERQQVDQTRLLGALDQRRARHEGPGLRVVSIARDGDDRILLPRAVFDSLSVSFQLDPIVKQHVHLNSMGFHHFGPENELDKCHTFFFGSFVYTIVWSYDIEKRQSSAILMLRSLERYEYGKPVFDTFVRFLEIMGSRVQTPFLLAWTAYIHIAYIIDENMYRVVDSLRDIEGFTGFGPTARGAHRTGDRHPVRPGLERTATKLTLADNAIDQLDKYARLLTDHNVHITNLQRHAILLTDMSDTLLKDNFLEGYCPDGPEVTVELEFFRALLKPMLRRISMSKPSLEYLHDRCKSLFSVVLSLVTHEDAEVNIAVAKDSRLIAEATRRDSAAMKTIALMTTFFLPGTFFAAVFAIPSLKWDHDKENPGIIQPGFGIYWAFAAPATVLILAFWFLWDQWGDRFTKWQKKLKITKMWDATRLEKAERQKLKERNGVSSSDLEMNRRGTHS